MCIRDSSHVDLIEPARIILIQKQRVGGLGLSVFSQSAAEEGCSHETGGEMHLLLLKLLHEVGNQPFAELIRHQDVYKRQFLDRQ